MSHSMFRSEDVNREREIEQILEEGRAYWSNADGGKPGIIEEKLTWQDVAVFIKTGQYSKLGRVPEEILRYRAFTTKMKDAYETIGDYVAARVFGVETEINAASNKLKAVWPSTSEEAEPQLVWRENDFPYSMVDGLEHHVLWSTGELTERAIQEAIAKEREGYESVFFINPPENKSVKNIEHATSSRGNLSV
eukprot:CAMPEP_0198224278 /NCGR_PEP_ID=MMETSP1445-20131203/96180_1 /TAXON_ID=36898 /ORGANISM="Pyramimonas sp., Strain CCMP2087" /LENGTH=192 /DNA_ID=CAMNT_0043903387 /DNA_START=299 /DNA_END=878 /DNA_ORIENTATION=-